MSETTGRASGREKLQALKAAQARQQRQRKMLGLIAALVAVVIATVGIMWGVSSHQKSESDRKAQEAAKATGFITSVTSVPTASFDQVGVGAANAFPKPMSGSQPMTQDGKPRVLYIGAEFCPYCAMERWALVAALSRFGTFTGLKPAVSSPDEGPLSNIQTMSFLDAKYTSKYLVFTSYETQDRLGKPLQQPAAADAALMQRFGNGGIPWVDWGGVATSGVGYDGNMLVGKTNTQIAKALSDPKSDIAQGVLGEANVVSAQLCVLTKGAPANVCSSPGVKAAAAKLPQ
ncbi:DUF929 family protein [Calidifontibacter sp. DB0510]|uniref:DUF929 family protein n=1 Tax=Metallococcus carri TaxID=1656884 RepID=A0A967EBL9_9MICO|nr:DUF929 family protein [Metallococcus carri]NHN57094.1 DUF929 family protein [Metallococcus carri]NOP39037.1 DUF929 family protein [Calidifontibacter sp. DB2511S]